MLIANNALAPMEESTVGGGRGRSFEALALTLAPFRLSAGCAD